jgi:hypothetical protein
VLAEHQIKANENVKVHVRIAASIKRALEEKDARRYKRGVKAYDLNTSHTNLRKHNTVGRYNNTKEYFFDYNTVEQILLSCAVLVCLAGVMFESDRFQAQDASGQLRYGWQRDLVTVLIVCIVISSLVYLVLVFMSEVAGYTPIWLKKCCKSGKGNALIKAADSIQNSKDDQIEMNMMNPAMMDGLAAEERTAFEQKMKEAEEHAALLRSENASLANERKKMKMLHGRGVALNKKVKKKGRSKRKKAEFAQKQSTLESTEISSGKEKGNEKSEKKPSAHDWEKHYDKNKGQHYWHNRTSSESTWVTPLDSNGKPIE